MLPKASFPPVRDRVKEIILTYEQSPREREREKERCREMEAMRETVVEKRMRILESTSVIKGS